jgi:NADH:ubiquinone oxidoreductase subunit 2 (subunit N)
VRFIKVMYLGDRIADNKPLALSPALQTALIVSVVGVIMVGFYPQPFIAARARPDTVRCVIWRRRPK